MSNNQIEIKLEHSRRKIEQCLFALLMTFIPFVFEVLYLAYYAVGIDHDPLANHDQGFIFSPFLDSLALIILIGVRVSVVYFAGNFLFKNKAKNSASTAISAIPIIGIGVAIYLHSVLSRMKLRADRELESQISREFVTYNSQTAMIGNAAGCFLAFGILASVMLLIVLSASSSSGASSSEVVAGVFLLGMIGVGILFLAGVALLAVYLTRPKR